MYIFHTSFLKAQSQGRGKRASQTVSGNSDSGWVVTAKEFNNSLAGTRSALGGFHLVKELDASGSTSKELGITCTMLTYLCILFAIM